MKHKFTFFLLLSYAQFCTAESELQVHIKSLKIGDSKDKVFSLLGAANSKEIHQWPGISCEQWVYKKNLPQLPPQIEEVTVTICMDRLVAHKYFVRSLFNL